MNHPRVRVDRVWAMSREREQMFSLVCSPGLLATLAGHWTGAGEVTPSRRLWTSYQSSDLRFFPVSAVWPSGRFSTSHARLQPLPLSKGTPPPDSHSGVPHTKTADHTAGAEGPSLSLTAKSPAARAMSHKDDLCKGWQPSLGQVSLE